MAHSENVIDLVERTDVDLKKAGPSRVPMSFRNVPYRNSLDEQTLELMGRIEARRKERLAEEHAKLEEERAPVGPGGLDPTEVLQSLPEEMQQAFINRDIEGLRNILKSLPKEEAAYHMGRCVDSGLWTTGEEEEDAPPVEVDMEAVEAKIRERESKSKEAAKVIIGDAPTIEEKEDDDDDDEEMSDLSRLSDVPSKESGAKQPVTGINELD